MEATNTTTVVTRDTKRLSRTLESRAQLLQCNQSCTEHCTCPSPSPQGKPSSLAQDTVQDALPTCAIQLAAGEAGSW